MKYATRIQLKSDTEANWNQLAATQNSDGFIPLDGELIIYTADNEHQYCRLKIGNGQTNVTQLPFIDSGTINGEEVEIVKMESYNLRPLTGSPDKLYVDLSTNNIYHYDNTTGYNRLANFTYDTGIASRITNCTNGKAVQVEINNNVLKFKSGRDSYLSWQDSTVVTGITKS